MEGRAPPPHLPRDPGDRTPHPPAAPPTWVEGRPTPHPPPGPGGRDAPSPPSRPSPPGPGWRDPPPLVPRDPGDGTRGRGTGAEGTEKRGNARGAQAQGRAAGRGAGCARSAAGGGVRAEGAARGGRAGRQPEAAGGAAPGCAPGAGTRLGRGAMRGPPNWPLRPLLSRGAAARAWTPAARDRACRPPTTALVPPRPWGARPGLPGRGAGLARLLGLWARLPGAPRVPRAALPGGPAVAARAGDEAWRRAPATPRDDPRPRPAAPGLSEARKLLGLAYPERRRLAGRAPGAAERGHRRGGPVRRDAVALPRAFLTRSAGRALACPENCRALRRRWGPAGGPFRVVVSRATLSQGCARSCGLSLCGSRACECPHAREEPGFPPLLLFFKLCKRIILYYALILTFTACVL